VNSFEPVRRSGPITVPFSPSSLDLSSVIPIYAVSTTPSDGSVTTFVFAIPIAQLILATVGGAPVDPANATALAGNLILSVAPGDPANPGLIEVGALYLK
jgi:hypothetical protein